MEYLQRAFLILCRRIKRETSLRSKFISSCSSQSFSLPDSIMYYISKNPSTSKLYQNLIQTCKYFFIKNPIIVSPNFHYSRDLGKWCTGKIRFKISQLICKFWITEIFNLTSMLPKLYKCDAKKVTLENEVISFNDLSLLTKTVEDIMFIGVTVKNPDDSTVQFEKIFESFFNVKTFRFSFNSAFPNITSKTFNELLKIPHFLKLQSMNLKDIPDTFDIEAFYVYMKENKTTKFFLFFDKFMSAPYKNRLEQICFR
uniref:Uncharacterized protein n=1 Tax=Panagrolaimus davidi TaxID=227884 RepID=A0A914QXJ6_9BILA